MFSWHQTQWFVWYDLREVNTPFFCLGQQQWTWLEPCCYNGRRGILWSRKTVLSKADISNICIDVSTNVRRSCTGMNFDTFLLYNFHKNVFCYNFQVNIFVFKDCLWLSGSLLHYSITPLLWCYSKWYALSACYLEGPSCIYSCFGNISLESSARLTTGQLTM